jgi:hypothetical protein
MKGQLYRCISPAPEHLWSNKDGSFVGLIREGDIVLDIDPFTPVPGGLSWGDYVEVLHNGKTGHIKRSCLKPIED